MKKINSTFKALSKNELSEIVGGQEEVNPCMTSGSSGPIPMPSAGGSSTAMVSGGPGSVGGGSSVVAVSNGNEAGVLAGTIGYNTSPTRSNFIGCMQIDVVSFK